MHLLKIPLQAGQPWPINRGRFVRVFDAVHPIEIKTTVLSSGSNQQTKLLANMGAEFTPFEKAELYSEKTQLVTIAYSELPIFDNRMGVEAATVLQVVSPQQIRRIDSFTVDNTKRTQILMADSKRVKALLSASQECEFFTTQTGGKGFKINGEFDDSGNNELWAVATVAAEISVLGYYYE